MADDRWLTGRIDLDASRAYALATNDPNPSYRSGAVTPLLYPAALIRPASAYELHRFLPMAYAPGTRSGVHAEHDVTFHRTVVPGMALRWRSKGHSIRQTPAGVLITARTEIVDVEHRPLADHLWTTMFVGGAVDPQRVCGPDLPDHRFVREAGRRPDAQMTFDIAADQTYRFGGVSGDLVGHALDDEIARSEGFERKIVQGMCTFAMCSAAVVAKVAGGDPARVRRIAGRFSATIHPESDLTVELFDLGRVAGLVDGVEAFAFEAVSNGVYAMRHGRAELWPAA